MDGTAVYGIDVKPPGMLHAALAQPPTLGGAVKTFNDEKARAMPGVVAVVLTSSGPDLGDCTRSTWLPRALMLVLVLAV